MSKKLHFTFIILSLMASSPMASATNLCKPSEKTLFWIAMGKLKDDAFVSNKKSVSLCTEGANTPLKTLIYRYGTTEKIELEFSAPKAGKFDYLVERNSPRGVDYMIEFNRGKYKYTLSTCLGMTCAPFPTTLTVSLSGKNIAELYGDYQTGEDNFFGTILLEDEKPNAIVFKSK